MKKFIGIFMVLALVMTTSFPTMSHAMTPHDAAKAEKAEVSSEYGDCHNHAKAEQSSKTAQNDKDASGECCDKGICKCVGGTCHNGLSKIFGNGSNSLVSLSSDSSAFAFDNQFVESALSNRLKRPPKA
ncbi:MAG: hypothetical protein SFW63_03545 [Alphaproteobacteria bacterium]|nr:hypothetical protein [Alphaproteobacteria bacterium]